MIILHIDYLVASKYLLDLMRSLVVGLLLERFFIILIEKSVEGIENHNYWPFCLSPSLIYVKIIIYPAMLNFTLRTLTHSF